MEKAVGTGPETKTIGDVPFTIRAKRVIELAIEEAKEHLVTELSINKGEKMVEWLTYCKGIEAQL